ncbi:MAG: GAF domain-containing protein [Anaerolineae bacterium]|nr:GAF domain-containing protein [Anaerolineae bacterium]
MVEVYLVITGFIFFAWLYALVRQTQQSLDSQAAVESRPIVPVNLMESDEAVVVAEGRGRVVYANDLARSWFGMDGGMPNLALMAQMVQPVDTLHDLLADSGHASFRLGQRRVEAVSHAIPSSAGQQMIVVMREVTSAGFQNFSEFDPLRAMAIVGDISPIIGKATSPADAVSVILQSIGHAIAYDFAEITRWDSDSQTLQPVGQPFERTPSGVLLTPEERPGVVYKMGEGYTGWIAMYRQPLLISDAAARTDIMPKTARQHLQSFVGVPLSTNDQFIGTIELGSRRSTAFDQRDVGLLQSIAGQIAAALEAARLYEYQSARVAELSGLHQIAEAMSQLAEPAEVYGQLTQRIAHLVGVELCGVLLYSDDDQMFYSRPPFYGVPDALVEHYRLSVVPDTELYSIWRHQAWWFTNDSSSPVVQSLGLDDLLAAISLNALALVPMIAGARRIGLLLVANKRGAAGFDEDDMRVLMSFATQAAVVAENARMYSEEQQRTRELGGLQQIAQTMGELRNARELYGQITERIAALMNVEKCGLLFYEPRSQMLIGQQPFWGLDDEDTIDAYRVTISPDSPIGRLWESQATWYTNDVRDDPVTRDTDFSRLAMVVGIHQMIIAPLVVGRNRLGLVQAANKTGGAVFSHDDMRVFSLFAGQAAILVDNARLYREMQHRTHEAEGLRAITEFAAQVAPLDEKLEQINIAIANLLQSDVVAIGLVDEKTGELVIEPQYMWGGALTEPYRIDAYAPGFEKSVLVSRRPFVGSNLRDDQRVLPQYRDFIEINKLRNTIQVPLTIGNRSIGELTVANKSVGDVYDDDDLQLLLAIATQVAAMIDRMRLYQATDQDLQARVQELHALSRVSQELRQTIELERILDVLRQEALRSTAATAASIVLLADPEDWPAPDQPQVDRRFGEIDGLAGLAPVEQMAVVQNQSITVPAYAQSELEAAPPRARTALAAPIAFGDDVVGLIHLYSTELVVFDERVSEFVATLTAQAAIAVGNARRYENQLRTNQQLRERADRMGRIFELGELFRRGAALSDMLVEVAQSIQETVDFNLVLISVVDEQEQVLRRTAQAGMPLPVFDEVKNISPPLEQVRGLMQDSYRVSNSYFLPAEGTEELTADLPTYQRLYERTSVSPRAWNPDDLLLVPFYGSGGRLLGMMSVDEPRSGRRPDINTVKALEIFANQAAFSIENFRLIDRIQREAEATRRERDRLAQLHMVASEIQSAPDVPSRLQVVAQGIHDAGWNHVIITLRDEHLEPTALIQAGYTADEALTLSDEVLPGDVWRKWINDLAFHELKLGAGYYLRYNRPWVRENVLNGKPPEPPTVSDADWHPQDVLYLPLVGQDQKRIIGIIEMTDPVDGHIPTQATLQPFELFASQAAAAIETTRLYLQTVRAAEQEQRLNEMMEVVSRSLNPEAVIQSIGQGLQQMVPFTRMSVAVYDEQAKRLDLLRANIAPDGSISMAKRVPLDSEKTAMGHTYREVKARVYRLGESEAARQEYSDLSEWYASGEHSTLIVPMVAGGQAVGSLHLGSELENAFSFQENLELIQRLANLSAVALANAHLYQQVTERATVLDEQAQRLAFVNRVSARMAETLDLSEVYRITLTELQDALYLQSAGLMMIEDENTARLVMSTHPMDKDMPELTLPIKGNPAAEIVMETRKPLMSSDLLKDERFKVIWDTSKIRGTQAMLIVPMIVANRVIGTIGLDSDKPRTFTETEIELAMTTANQAALAIEKARLFAETTQRATELDEHAKRLALINRVSSRLAQTLDPQEIYQITITEAQAALQVAYGGMVLFENEDIGRLVFDTHPTYSAVEQEVFLTLKGNRSIEHVRATQKPLVSEDVLSDPLFEPVWDVLRERGTVSLIILPLVVGGSVVGTIGLDSDKPRTFTDAEFNLTETIASQASLAIEKARLYSETLGLTIFNQAVVESIQQGIVVLDADLTVRRVNRYMVEHYGWSTVAVGQKIFEYRPDYAGFLREPIAVALGMGEPQSNYDVERRDMTGERSIRNYYVYPMIEGRVVTGIVMLVEDVTERALLEADLNTRAVQMAALADVSSQITATLEPDQVISLILDALERVVPYDGVSLWLRSSVREELNIAAARGYQHPDSPEASDLVGLTTEIAYSPLFREMSDNARVLNAGDVGAGDPRFPYGEAAVYKNWLGAPLISKGNVVGVLALEKLEPNFYSPLHEQLALTFANQAAVALDNARLFQETRSRATALDEQAQRLALLNRVSLALAQSLDIENIFEIALRETAIALDLHEGSAMYIDVENDLGRVIVDYPRGDEPPEAVLDLTRDAAIQRVRASLIPLAVDTIEGDVLEAPLRAMMRRDDIVSTMLVPLVVGGQVIGVLRLDSPDEPRDFTPAQIELAQTIASQAAIAVQNASLFEQTTIRTNELETLFESAQATAVTLDLNEVVRRVTMQMLSALRSDACTVFIWDDVSNRLEVRGDISARPADVTPVHVGDVYHVSEYPLRERSLHERELKVIRADDPDIPKAELDMLQHHRAASRMLIPLVVNEISIGLVELETLDPNHYYKAEDIRLASTLASQAAISIENARLQTETRRTVEELYIINDMSAALSSAVSLERLLEVVDNQLPSLIDAQAIYVALYDSASDEVSFPLAVSVRDDKRLDMPSRRLGNDEFSFVIRQQAPLLLAGDNLGEVRRSLGIESPLSPDGSFLGVPLFAGDDIIGSLAARDDEDTLAFSHNDQRILTTVSSQLGVAIQSARLFQHTLELAEELDRRVQERTAELEQERQHISTLYQITTELSTSLDMDRLMARSLEMVSQAVNATQGVLLSIDEVSAQFQFRAYYGGPDVDVEPPSEKTLGLDEGLAGWAVQNQQSVIVDDVRQDPRWRRASDDDDNVRSAMVVLIQATEEVLGVLMVYSDQPGAFNDDHLRLVAAAVSQIANAMSNAELYSLIRDQAERLGMMLRQEQVEATKNEAVLDSVADGVMVADADGRVIVFNTTAQRILGLSSEQVMGEAAASFTGLYGAGGLRWSETVERWIGSPTAYQPGEFLEEQVTLDDDRVIGVRLSPVYMGDQFLGTVSVFRDITREVEVDRLKSEFVATVSHELRTPMTSIKGYADLLLLGAAGVVTEQQQRFLETIKQNADRLSILVNDLLDISRIDQGRVELKFMPIEVGDLLDTVAGHVRGRSEDEKRPLSVITQIPEDEKLIVWGDYDKVQQILTNLGDNAFNYTRAGGTITLAARQEDPQHVVLSVSDTGIGIVPEITERIFERFFRGDETHELVMDTPGTGLGLSIVRELVGIHHGEIWFESEVGKGTTFYVKLLSEAPGSDDAA